MNARRVEKKYQRVVATRRAEFLAESDARLAKAERHTVARAAIAEIAANGFGS